MFARDYPHDYPEVEAVLVLHHHRLRMREIPVRMYVREGGLSSITSGKSAYYMIKVLLAIFVGLFRARPTTRARRRRPGGRGARNLMEARVQLLAIVASGILLLIVLELVRRRRLLERYALLWLLSGVVLLILSSFRGLLEDAAGS